jgi:hypothetical protein
MTKVLRVMFVLLFFSFFHTIIQRTVACAIKVTTVTVYATCIGFFIRRCFSTATCFGLVMSHLQAIYVWSLRSYTFVYCIFFNCISRKKKD